MAVRASSDADGCARGEPGYRVFKLKTKKAVKEKLKEFYDLLTSLNPVSRLPKNTMQYREEWENSFLQVVHSRLTASAGRWLSSPKKRKRRKERHIPKRPPFLLSVRFLQSGERPRARGRSDAPVIVDLRKRELRIPCIGVTIPLPERLVKALEEENNLTPRPEFVAQLCSDGRLRIIAKRAPEPRPLEPPLRIIAVDENSRYGFALAVFDFDSSGYCRLVHFEILKPPNHGYREKVAAALKKYACKPAEALESVRELLPFIPTPSDAERLARKTLARKRRLNDAFAEGFVARVRGLVREALRRGAAVVIVVDPIDEGSLRGTPLQGTLLRTRKRLKNLARYEGAHFAEIRASGKLCPFCGAKGRERDHRVFECPRCGTVWDRDRAALVNLILRYLETLHKEESQDTDAMRLIDAMLAWLKRHKKFLLR
jgi:Zn-finger nucleic acid-binding protein